MKINYGDVFVEKETGERFIVSKYWDDDTDANSYKIKLKSLVYKDYFDSYYSMDFVSLVKSGVFKKLKN